jgi:hypothetical protein
VGEKKNQSLAQGAINQADIIGGGEQNVCKGGGTHLNFFSNQRREGNGRRGDDRQQLPTRATQSTTTDGQHKDRVPSPWFGVGWYATNERKCNGRIFPRINSPPALVISYLSCSTTRGMTTPTTTTTITRPIQAPISWYYFL